MVACGRMLADASAVAPADVAVATAERDFGALETALAGPTLDLDRIWATLQPHYDGNALAEALDVPKGPLIGGLMAAQREWQLAQPAHQQAAVGRYLNATTGLPPAASYNASNRAYPDIAAVAADDPAGGLVRPARVHALLLRRSHPPPRPRSTARRMLPGRTTQGRTRRPSRRQFRPVHVALSLIHI